MKSVILILAGLLAFGLAQEGEKVRLELERTDKLIELARPIIEQSGSNDAGRVFAEAVAQQARAWDALRQRRYLDAAGKTMWARQLVERALKLAKFDPQRIGDEIRRTQDLMNDAGPVIERSGMPRALDLWRMAKGEQETSRKSFDAKQYLVALKLTMTARLHTKAALELVRRTGDPEMVRAELERTDALLERARQRLAGSDNARGAELLAKTQALQDQAWQSFKLGQYFNAVKLTFAARDLLLRAWEVAGPVTGELAGQAIAEADRLIEKWSAVITERGPEEARQLLAQALEQRERAGNHNAAQDFRLAWQEANQARRLLGRAVELVEEREQ